MKRLSLKKLASRMAQNAKLNFSPPSLFLELSFLGSSHRITFYKIQIQSLFKHLDIQKHLFETIKKKTKQKTFDRMNRIEWN